MAQLTGFTAGSTSASLGMLSGLGFITEFDVGAAAFVVRETAQQSALNFVAQIAALLSLCLTFFGGSLKVYDTFLQKRCKRLAIRPRQSVAAKADSVELVSVTSASDASSPKYAQHLPEEVLRLLDRRYQRLQPDDPVLPPSGTIAAPESPGVSAVPHLG